MAEEHPVTVRRLSDGEIVAVTTLAIEHGEDGARGWIEAPEPIPDGEYELEFDDGTRFYTQLRASEEGGTRLDLVD